MRKITYLLLALCMIFLVSCNSKKTPTNTVKSYLDAIKAEKFDQAVQLFKVDSTATAEDLKVLEDKIAASMKEKGGLQSYELPEDGEKIAEDGASATVKTLLKMGNGTADEAEFKLTKVNGVWKINLSTK